MYLLDIVKVSNFNTSFYSCFAFYEKKKWEIIFGPGFEDVK